MAINELKRVRRPDPDTVICPACAHDFEAISVNVQAELARLRAANAELVEAIRSIRPVIEKIHGLVEAVDSALSRAEQAKPETCVDVEKIDTAIAEALGEAYDCTRVWESWGYGAMRSDDFVRVSDDPGRIMEIRDAMLKAMGTPEQEAKPETCVWAYSDHIWTSGCGNRSIHSVREGIYCPFCGRRIEQAGKAERRLG